MIKQLKRAFWKLRLRLLSRKSREGVEYIYRRRHSDILIIVFNSATGRYNYFRTLQDIKVDQLFICDSWADNFSYYWFEGKQDYPERYTQQLIETILAHKKYRQVITLGSSKGATAAIYYGLKNNVDLVFAGACKYLVGNQVGRFLYSRRPERWQRMIGGEPTQEWIDILNRKMEDMIEAHRNSRTVVRMIYSTEEHTYPDDIVHILKKFDECGIRHEDCIEKFTNHNENGKYVKREILAYFNKKS